MLGRDRMESIVLCGLLVLCAIGATIQFTADAQYDKYIPLIAACITGGATLFVGVCVLRFQYRSQVNTIVLEYYKRQFDAITKLMPGIAAISRSVHILAHSTNANREERESKYHAAMQQYLTIQSECGLLWSDSIRASLGEIITHSMATKNSRQNDPSFSPVDSDKRMTELVLRLRAQCKQLVNPDGLAVGIDEVMKHLQPLEDAADDAAS